MHALNGLSVASHNLFKLSVARPAFLAQRYEHQSEQCHIPMQDIMPKKDYISGHSSSEVQDTELLNSMYLHLSIGITELNSSLCFGLPTCPDPPSWLFLLSA